MTSNIQDFSRRLSGFSRTIPDNLVLPFHKKIAGEALTRIVNKTPVDTGRARGNWQVTLEQPAEGEVDALDTVGGTTIASGFAAFANLRPFGTIWIANNVEYIVYLEDGRPGPGSLQAPNGMVGVTVAELNALFP